MRIKDLSTYDSGSYMLFTNPGLIHKDLETLKGIITGILADHEVNVKEHLGLHEWIHHNKSYEFQQPYKDVLSRLRDAIADNILEKEEAKDIIWLCDRYTTSNPYYDDLTAGIQVLHGIVKGISIDDIITYEELSFLDKWLDENEYLKNTWPYDELYNLTTKILADKVITAEEHQELLSFCNALCSEYKTCDSNKAIFSTLSSNFYQIDPQIEFKDRKFCITGESKKYKRREIAERIQSFGGLVQNSVSSKLSYLIVCEDKNVCWAFNSYGRKIEDAMYHRQQGAKLVIVHEYDLYDAFESF